QGPDELPSPKHVPGKAAMGIFLAAAEARGAPADKVQAARASHERLQGVIKAHAGDRASAEILLGRFTDEGRSRLEIQLRREAFRANPHVLGIKARFRHQLDIVAPAPRGFMPELARVRGYYGIQRTRADARWVLSTSFVIQTTGTAKNYRRTPLADLPRGATA